MGLPTGRVGAAWKRARVIVVWRNESIPIQADPRGCWLSVASYNHAPAAREPRASAAMTRRARLPLPVRELVVDHLRERLNRLRPEDLPPVDEEGRRTARTDGLAETLVRRDPR